MALRRLFRLILLALVAVACIAPILAATVLWGATKRTLARVADARRST